MANAQFTATLLEGHKGAAFEVPFDPEERWEMPPEKLRAVFKDLVEKHAVFDAVVAQKMIPDEDARIDEQGVLKLRGRFQTAPKQVKYQLGFIESEGAWKLSGVTIDIE